MENKTTILNNRLHSLIWNVVIYFAIIYFGETICGEIGGLLLEPAAFFGYGLFSEIDLFTIIISMIVARGIGIAAARDYRTMDIQKYQDTCAHGLRICLITGAILAAGSLIASYILFYRTGFSSLMDPPALSCFIFEPLLSFLFPLLCLLRELAYIRKKLCASIWSGILYIIIYAVFTYLLIASGWAIDAIILAHLLASISIVCLLMIVLSRSNQSFRFTTSHKMRGTGRMLLSGLPTGLGYALYSFSIYLFSQVPMLPQTTKAAQTTQITYGSVSFGVQILSMLISIILMSSTIIVLSCTESFFGNKSYYEGRAVLKRILVSSSVIWFIIGIVLFFVAPIFTDAMRITSANEINITLIGMRICSLTLWSHSLVWMLIQYYVIKRNHKMWIALCSSLLFGFILMILVIKLFPSVMIIAWLLFAFTPFLALLVAWICYKKITRTSYVEPRAEVSTETSVKAKIKTFLPKTKHLILGLVASILFAGGLIFSTLTYYEMDMLPDVSNKALFNFEHRSKVLANDGTTVLADLYFPRHETINSLNEVSPYVVQAIIAREDCRFYNHIGIDLKGIARAAFSTLTGQGLEGGSTITMQLAKNTVLANTSQLRTFDRKISEIILAIRMERIYDKDSILTMYLNNTNFGNGYYGIKSASKHYFRKDPKDLTLAEAVALSTLIQRPNDYRMASNEESALKARSRTLNSMERVGYITKQEAEDASSQLLNWDPFEVIINHSKVTPAMYHEPVLIDHTVYFSVDDVSRYFDPYLYFSAREELVATFGTGGVAEFDLKNNSVTLNEETKPCELQKINDVYYMPLSDLSELYGIDIYQDDDTLLITSRDRALISAKVVSETPVTFLNSDNSYAVGKLQPGDKVYIKDTDGDIYEGWSRIRTNDNLVGYVKSKDLSGRLTEKEAAPTAKTLTFDEPLRITWDRTISYTNAQKILDESNGAYNTIMPVCFSIKDGTVTDRNGTISEGYIQMFNEAGFYLFPTFDYIAEDDKAMNSMSALLSSYYTRKSLIQQILHYVDLYHLPGINIDFEHMYKRNARGFTCFIRELKAQLEPRGCLLFVDVIAPDGDENWSGCYEYWQLGMATDYIVLMAYDFTSKGSDTPGSGAPYYWVERSVNKLINRENIPADKIILSMPLFIRLWNVDKETGLALDNIDLVISMIKENIPENAEIIWLEKEQQHFTEFIGDNGILKQAWLEDIDSLSVKMQLIPQYHLSGAAFYLEQYSNAEINASLAEAMDVILDTQENELQEN